MNENNIDSLRYLSRKLIRELGILHLNKSNTNDTPAHWHSLIEISKEPGITISTLGSLLLMSKSSISRLIKTLANDNLVECREGQDKREKYLYLTDNGYSELKKIDSFSNSKIKGAFDFLTETEINQIIQTFSIYATALEKSRLIRDQVKIATLPTSRTLRKQIIKMISNIQENEFSIPITPEINICVLKAEEEFYYNNSYNFWYAIDSHGKILGSIGLKNLDGRYAEIKKFFVIKEYRGKGVAQKLMHVLLKSALKHKFEFLILGTVDKLQAAHKFYSKFGFKNINQNELPSSFEKCHLDSIFFLGKVKELVKRNELESI